MSIEPFETPEEFQKWTRDFEHHLVAVRLFGTHEAWAAAQRLADRVNDAIAVAPNYDGEPEDRFLAAWQYTIEAMRLDTAPARGEGA